MTGDHFIDRSGRVQYTRKSNADEIARRDVIIARLHRRGHSTKEICEAIGMGESAVRERLRSLGIGGQKRPKGRGRVIEPCLWRDQDLPLPTPPEQQPRWRQSRIIGMAQMLNDEYRESNFANVLANQVTDAEVGGDRDWLHEALATLSAAIEKLERARRVLTDDEYRVACRDTLEGVEQMRRRNPPLRAVP